MNGRLYDPAVGRFLSADPFVQDAGNTQHYNRYSYCLNNPLRYTDPSGYTQAEMWTAQMTQEMLAGLGGWATALGYSVNNSIGSASGDGFVGSGSSTPRLDRANLLNTKQDAAGGWRYDGKTESYYNIFSGDKGWDNASSSIPAFGTQLPSNTDLSSISIGNRNGKSGVWFQTVNLVGNSNGWVDGVNSPNSWVDVMNKFIAFDITSSRGDGYGEPMSWTRLKNLPQAIWNGDVFKKDPNVISLTMADNPISLIMPFSTIPKTIVGARVVLGGSTNTLITSAFFQEIGIRGMYGTKIWTPFGYAKSWETLFGRWSGMILVPALIYDKTTKK